MLTCGGLFDGVGCLAYGLHLAGWEHSWLCEWDPWRRDILRKRWPGIPVYDDVRAVGAGCRPVTLLAGGFPCKGASAAGKREGFGHPETVLWREMARAIRELRPRFVLVENVANILGLHGGEVWGEVVGDLASERYDVVWDCLPAAAVGAPHLRDRVFAIATNTDGSDEGWSADQRGEQDGRTDVGRGSVGAASNAVRAGLEGTGLRGAATDRGREVAADSERKRGPGRRAPRHLSKAAGGAQDEARERRGDAADDRCAASTDAEVIGRDGGKGSHAEPVGRGERESGPDPDGRGIAVDWGEYEPAIQRWEAIHGPAPKPLLRRVDDRHTSRLERSRLSALGDGVQVQVGYVAGRYIAGLAEGRLAA